MEEKLPKLYKKYYNAAFIKGDKEGVTNIYIKFIATVVIPIILEVSGICFLFSTAKSLGISLIILGIFIIVINMKNIQSIFKNKNYFIKGINSGEYRCREVVIEELFNEVEQIEKIHSDGRVSYNNIEHYKVKYSNGISVEVPKEVFNTLSQGKRAYCFKIEEDIVILPNEKYC